MSNEIANLISRKFISRPDVKAIQNRDGSWRPHTHNGKHNGDRLPWTRSDLNAHLTGEMTFGHYMLSQDDKVKLFAFDIDLEKNVPESEPRPFQGYWIDEDGYPIPFDPRQCWQDRSHPSRSYVKMQFKMLAAKIMSIISGELGLHCAAAYSGGKGIHVYGFTGALNAADARDGAMIVLDDLGGWEASRGDNFFKTVDQSNTADFRNFSIEIFPKQSSLEGKDLGNLMRLPLGRNLRNPKDPTFFIDMTSPMGQMIPRDPIQALTANPWKLPNEL